MAFFSSWVWVWAAVSVAHTTVSEITIRTPYYRLIAPAEIEGDARLLATTLDEAIRQICADFASADAEKLLRAADVEIRVAAAANEHCGIGQANNRSSWNDGRLAVTIDVLAPSAHPDPGAPNAGRTMANEAMDANYCRKVLIHEYGTVLLESITRTKPNGWSFWNAPTWFVQGAEEYLALMYSTEQARTATLQTYLRMTRDQHLVTNDFGLEANSPYVSGAVMVAYMVEKFGRDSLIALLKSDAPTFGKAVRQTTRASPDEFYAGLQAWLDEKIGR